MVTITVEQLMQQAATMLTKAHHPTFSQEQVAQVISALLTVKENPTTEAADEYLDTDR